MSIWRELPPGVDSVSELVRLLNEQIREQEDTWNAAGSRIRNVGPPQERTDALSLSEADRRYLRLGWLPPPQVIQEGDTIIQQGRIWRDHTADLLDMTVGTKVLDAPFRLSLPEGKLWRLARIQITTKPTAAASLCEVNIFRRRTETGPWSSLFGANHLYIQAGGTRGEQTTFAIQDLYHNDEIDFDIVANGGLDNCSITFLGELIGG